MPLSNEDQVRLISEYKAAREHYQDFAKSLAGLIENLLSHATIQTHSVSFRSKDLSSFTGKLSRPDKSYRRLMDITDLAGVRVTTYFADDVDLVAELLRSEFSVDDNSSIDKRQFADPNQFGYRSLHYVLSFNANRAGLTEYRNFSEFKCEVQVRSILQHAWAEIEHDLGYKSAAGVPATLRRKFARIASLLELADDEFSSIRSELNNYETQVRERIRETPGEVDLDLPSFKTLYMVPSSLTALDDTVLQTAQGTLDHNETDIIDNIIELLSFFGIKTIHQLETLALRERKTVSEFVKYWLGEESIGKVESGVGAFYLLYVLAWRTGDRKRVSDYFERAALGEPEDREDAIDRLMKFKPDVHSA